MFFFLVCLVCVMNAGEGGRVGGRIHGGGGIDHGKHETAKDHPQEDDTLNPYIEAFAKKKGF